MQHAVHVLLMLHHFAEAAKFDGPWHDSIECLQMRARFLHAHVS